LTLPGLVDRATRSKAQAEERIRVFHLIKGLGRGGAEMLLPEGLRFADRKHFCYGYGYFLPQKLSMVRGLEDQEVEVTCFTARSNPSILASTFRVARHLKSWDADLLHCHMPMAGVVGRVAARLAGIPVVYTEHNKMERFHPLSRWLNLVTWTWQHEVVAVSEDVAKSIAAAQAGMAIAGDLDEWFGLKVLQHGPVLYLDFELDVDEQYRRVRDLATGLGVDIPKYLAYLSSTGMDTEEVFRRARLFCKNHGAKAVIIDSMGLAMGGDMERLCGRAGYSLRPVPA
jgi:hypothetical protein